jgi:hypothetical protein
MGERNSREHWEAGYNAILLIGIVMALSLHLLTCRNVNLEVNQSHYRPGHALKAPGG